MASPTDNNRLELQAFNANPDTWGVDHLNPVIEGIDQSLDGIYDIDVSASSSINLTTTDYVDAPFRNRVLRFFNSRVGDFDVTLPAGIDKTYFIINEATSDIIFNSSVTISALGTSILTVQSGVITANSSYSSPEFRTVIDGISTAANIDIVPTFNGSAFVIDPTSSVTTINILDALDGAEDLDGYVGYNYIALANGVAQPYSIEITGLKYSDGTPLQGQLFLSSDLSYVRIAKVVDSSTSWPVDANGTTFIPTI